MRAKRWSQRQLKKARWKKSLQRAKKRGPVYGGFIRITDCTVDDHCIEYLRYLYAAIGDLNRRISMTLEETRNAVREYHYRCRDKNSENHTSDGIEIDPHTLAWAEYWLTKMSEENCADGERQTAP